MKTVKQPDTVNHAMAPWFHFERPWRGVADPRRSLASDLVKVVARTLLLATVVVPGVAVGCNREHSSAKSLTHVHRGPTISELSDQWMVEDGDWKGSNRSLAFTVDHPDTPFAQ